MAETATEELVLEEVALELVRMDADTVSAIITDDIGAEKARRSEKKIAVVNLANELGGKDMATYIGIIKASSSPNDKGDLVLDPGPIYETLFPKGDFVSLINPDVETSSQVQFARIIIKCMQSALANAYLVKMWEADTGRNFAELTEQDRNGVALKDYIPSGPPTVDITMADVGKGAYRDFARKNGLAEKVYSPSKAGSTQVTNLSLAFGAL